jgi:hypothetical protein
MPPSSNNMIPKEPEELLNIAKSLFEANEDLNLVLVGGLAAQKIYANREVRKTSDIDILAPREDAEKFVERMKENGYETFYNTGLDKYSVFRHKEGIHIDVYPGKIGKYSIENIKKVLDINGIRVVSPEDLVGIKLYAYLTSEMGKKKHLVDIYSILIGKPELDLSYFLERVVPYVSKITEVSEKEIIEAMCNGSEGVLKQFSPKERRFIKEECERILNTFKQMKGYGSKPTYSGLMEEPASVIT